MSGGEGLRRVLPADLRAAIADGWEGVTLLADAPADEPVTLVCAARESRLRGLEGCAVTVDAPEAAGTSAGRLLVLAIEQAPPGDAGESAERPGGSMSVGVDLAYPEARALVERACADAALRIAWVACGPEPDLRCETIGLRPDGCAHLRAAMARVAEWHTGPPIPLGVSESAWETARRSPPRLVEGSFAEGRVALVVPARTLSGVDARSGRVAFASALVPPRAEAAPAGATGDLELRLVWEGRRAPVARRVALGLDEPEQRRLAARLSGQRQMIVMSVGVGSPGPSAHVRVSLGAPARGLILRATLAADRRPEEGCAGGSPG